MRGRRPRLVGKEKGLKAFLAWHDVAFRKTHDLGELGRQSIAIEPSLEPELRAAAGLTEYAWRFRYPGDIVEPEPELAEAVVRVAEGVVTLMASQLGGDARN